MKNKKIISWILIITMVLTPHFSYAGDINDVIDNQASTEHIRTEVYTDDAEQEKNKDNVDIEEAEDENNVNEQNDNIDKQDTENNDNAENEQNDDNIDNSLIEEEKDSIDENNNEEYDEPFDLENENNKTDYEEEPEEDPVENSNDDNKENEITANNDEIKNEESTKEEQVNQTEPTTKIEETSQIQSTEETEQTDVTQSTTEIKQTTNTEQEKLIEHTEQTENDISTSSEITDEDIEELVTISTGSDVEEEGLDVFGDNDSWFYFKYIDLDSQDHDVKIWAYKWTGRNKEDTIAEFNELVDRIAQDPRSRGFYKAPNNPITEYESYNYELSKKTNLTNNPVTIEYIKSDFGRFIDNTYGVQVALTYGFALYRTEYTIEYDLNLPTDSSYGYEFADTRISIATDWEAELTTQKTYLADDNSRFVQKFVVKGKVNGKVPVIIENLPPSSTEKRKMKKLYRWRLNANGTGSVYLPGVEISDLMYWGYCMDIFNNAPTSIKLYADWQDIDVRSFYITYRETNNYGGYWAETKGIYAYDYTDVFDDILNQINCDYDGFYKYDIYDFDPDSTDAPDSSKYKFTANGNLTKEQLKSAYLSWLNDYDSGTYKNVAYGAAQKPKVVYKKTMPTGYANINDEDWTVYSSQVSDDFSWDVDLATSSTSFQSNGVMFSPAIIIKGSNRMCLSANDRVTGEMKIVKLTGWNTSINGTERGFNFGDSVENKNNPIGFDWNTLTLYPVWETLNTTKFSICYLDDDNNKQIANIYNLDNQTKFDTTMNNIPNYYDGFYDLGDMSTYTTEDAIKNAYNPNTQGTLTKEQLKTQYLTWVNQGATTNKGYGAIYKAKHFYLAYTVNGRYASITDETTYDSTYVDQIVNNMKYTKIRGWYEIVPSGEYNQGTVNNLYDLNTTTNLITTNELKATYSNWRIKKKRNFAFGASVSPLDSISLKTGTTHKTYYKVDQTIDPTNLVIIPHFADGTVGDEIPYAGNETEFTFNPALGTALNTTNNKITVSYGLTGYKKSVDYDIEVTTAIVEEIKIITTPSKIEYVEGQKIDPTGLVIGVKYDDLTTANINYLEGDTRFTFNPDLNQNLALTNNNVSVSYSGKTTSYDITVREKQISSIEKIDNTPTKTTYFEGDTLDAKGLKIKVNFDNGTFENVDYDGNESDFQFTPATGSVLNTIGNNTITVKYKNDKTLTFDVNVVAVVVDSISISSMPNTVSYIEGNNLDVSGLKIKAHYNNNKENVIDYNNTNFTLSPAAGTELNTIGNNVITVTYEGKSTTFNVSVVAKQLESISLNPQPTKTSYLVGETIDPTGLQITLHYDNGTQQGPLSYVDNQADITFEPTLSNPLSIDISSISVIYKNDKRVKFNISVREPSPADVVLQSIGILNPPTKDIYNEGEKLEPQGLAIIATFSNLTSENISYSGNEARFVFNPDLNTALTYANTTINVLYNGKQTSLNININRNRNASYNRSGNNSESIGHTNDKFYFHVRAKQESANGRFYNVEEDVNVNGKIVKTIDTYYIDGDGVRTEGWLRTNDMKWYLFEYEKTKDNGKMIKGFRLVEDSWFYFDNQGIMAVGFNDINNDTYYFETTRDLNEGKMATGWKLIEDKWYYFTKEGKLIKNSTTPDGYKVGLDGAWENTTNTHYIQSKIIYNS